MNKRYEYISNGKIKLQEVIDNTNEYIISERDKKN